jgi:predicted alpha/beta-fold hydrolase
MRLTERGFDFEPLPMLGNPHVQTFLGNVLRCPRLPVATSIHHVPLPDGDRLVIYDSASQEWQDGRPVAVLVHGLGGNARSGFLLRMAHMLLPLGWRVVRMDLRSCGRGLPLARRPYHAGSSDDVRAVLATVRCWAPESPLVLIGISLGGNIVLKLAAEAADRPVPGLARVAAVAPPIDLERCALLISQPGNRLYEMHFLHELVALARRRERCFPDLPRVRFPETLSLRTYDELYTAPRCGFADAADYYRQSSSLPLIARIGVPTLILTARDDPFVAVGPFGEIQAPPHVEVRIVDRGGHLGFIGWDGAGGIRWGERRVVEWLTKPRGG